MQQILDYIIYNYQWLLPIVISVVEFILLLIFRRHYGVTIQSTLYDDVVTGIKLAEERYGSGNGGKKHQFVRDFIKDKYGSTFYYGTEYLIDRFIERILSTPQKKGGK